MSQVFAWPSLNYTSQVRHSSFQQFVKVKHLQKLSIDSPHSVNLQLTDKVLVRHFTDFHAVNLVNLSNRILIQLRTFKFGNFDMKFISRPSMLHTCDWYNRTVPGKVMPGLLIISARCCSANVRCPDEGTPKLNQYN